uniref:ATP-dependent RNA helicase n=1 Tax=Salmo trutta TaxID=8032 RepID=A0A673YFI1_SALTR
MKLKSNRSQIKNVRSFSRPKSAKRWIHVKGSWKAVELDPGLFSEEGMGGLVCFEELTYYRLIDSAKEEAKAEKDQKKRKEKQVREIRMEANGKRYVREVVTKMKRLKNQLRRIRKQPNKMTQPHRMTSQDTTDSYPLNAKWLNSPKRRQRIGPMRHALVLTKTHVTAWKDLFVPDQVLKALSSLGFGSPTAIQTLALPPAIRDHMDIVGAAETGSGKTLSFAIPMIHHILEWKERADESEGATDGQTEPGTQVESLYLPTVEESEDKDADDDEKIIEEDEEMYHEDERCVKVVENMEFDFDNTAEEETLKVSEKQPLLGLVLCPTRELAVQVKHHIDAVAKFTGIKTAIVVGGMAQQKQIRMLKRRPEIVIATPGRLWEMIKERHPHLVNLRQCLVIDEADRMVERGHFAELESLLEMLNTVQFNPKRQTFVFSATLTMAHSLPTHLQKKGKKVDQRSKLEVLMEKVGIRSKPKVIDLTRKEATVETLTETRIHCEKEEKDFFLYYFLLQYPGRTMVFANSIDCIKRLNSLLVILDCTPLPLHANMHQKQRLKNLERFAERESCVLLTTDVAARGLDIPNVQHVIHYQVPRTSETCVHRSGRTARATKEGLSLLLVGPDDMMNFKRIYRALGKDEEVPMFPFQSKCMAAIKVVNMARKIEKIEFHNSREKQHNSWFKQEAEALEVDLDDDVFLGKTTSLNEFRSGRLPHKKPRNKRDLQK